MAPRVVKSLTNMEIDEISLVDRGANQHATVAIAKRAPEEDTTMPDLYDEDGNLLDPSALEHGQTVYDEDGAAYEYTLPAEDAEVVTDTTSSELAGVAKRDPFGAAPQPSEFAKSVMEELSKADSDKARDEVLSKAFSRVNELEGKFEELSKAANAERDLRLEREYIAKADTYNLPIDAQELGPVLKRMVDKMSFEDCSVIHKALEASGGMIFDEIGSIGGGDNNDVMATVAAQATELSKSLQADGVGADHVTAVFDQNPAAYDEYLASRRGF